VKSEYPNDTASDYAKIRKQLADFERNLPSEHGFNELFLAGYRKKNEDLVSCPGFRDGM